MEKGGVTREEVANLADLVDLGNLIVVASTQMTR